MMMSCHQPPITEIETSSRGTSLSMEVRPTRARARDTTPESDGAKLCRQPKEVKPIKKVQVVYYLSRNGLLEHPHYMELTLFPTQPLRLKDVLDRLVALRGSGMLSLYSWSCKRSYKTGYVWYDLTTNDIIHPAEGAEYVLKGSELVEGCSARFQKLNMSSMQATSHHQDSKLDLKRKPAFNCSPQSEAEEYEEQEEEYEDGEKACYTSSTTTPHSRCSRGVSTDEDQETTPPESQISMAQTKVNIVNDNRILADKDDVNANNSSKRYEYGEPALSRNSVLLQLIACGSSAVSKGKAAPFVSNVMKRSESLEREVLRKRAVKISEEEMINYMSENPRFGNLQSEEKEYFSGSLLESMKEKQVASEPQLKKSNSYNDERSRKTGVGEITVGHKKEKKGKCIPRKKSYRKRERGMQ